MNIYDSLKGQLIFDYDIRQNAGLLVTDHSGHGNHGVITKVSTCPSFGVSDYGSVLNFDKAVSSAAFITTPINKQITGQFTAEYFFWPRTAGGLNLGRLFGGNNGGSESHFSYLTNSRQVFYNVMYNAGVYSQWYINGFPAWGDWYHFMVSHNVAQGQYSPKMWINGVPQIVMQTSDNGGADPLPLTYPYRLFNRYSPTRGFDGLMAFVRWYDGLDPEDSLAQQMSVDAYARRQTQKFFSFGSLHITSGAASMSVAGSMSTAGSITKGPSHLTSGVLMTAGAVIKDMVRGLSGSLNTTGSLLKSLGRTVSGSLTPTGSLGRTLVKLLTFVGVLTPIGGVSRDTGKTNTAEMTPSGGLYKSIIKTAITGIMNLAGTVQTLVISGTYYLTVAGSLVVSGLLRRNPTKTILGSLAPTGGVIKTLPIFISGMFGPTGTVTQLPQKVLAGMMSGAGFIQRATSRAVSGSFSTAGSVVKWIGKTAFTGTLTTSGIAEALKKVPGLRGMVTLVESLLYKLSESTTLANSVNISEDVVSISISDSKFTATDIPDGSLYDLTTRDD